MFTVHYKSKDKEERSVRVGKVMFGTGRKPNTRGIGLEVSRAAHARTVYASQSYEQRAHAPICDARQAMPISMCPVRCAHA